MTAEPKRVLVRRRGADDVAFVVTTEDAAWLPAPAASPSDTFAGEPAYFLCEAYAAGLCPAGTRCPDVHVDVRRAKKLRPHFRVPDAPGPRLGAPGQLVAVARVNERLPSLVVDASQCLPTRASPKSPEASRDRQRVPSLCGRFVGPHARCDYGSACRFVHLLGPTAAAETGGASDPDLCAAPPVSSSGDGASQPPLGAAVPAHDGGTADAGDAPSQDAPETTRDNLHQQQPAPQHPQRRFWHDPYGVGWTPQPPPDASA